MFYLTCIWLTFIMVIWYILKIGYIINMIYFKNSECFTDDMMIWNPTLIKHFFFKIEQHNIAQANLHNREGKHVTSYDLGVFLFMHILL